MPLKPCSRRFRQRKKLCDQKPASEISVRRDPPKPFHSSNPFHRFQNMSTRTTRVLAPAADAPSVTPELLQQRLAEAANYAVLRRVAPVLRHDVAGLMQPVGMLMMVLQRRVQMPEPDLQAIAKNVASVSALTKDATIGSMNAMDWVASREDTSVGLREGADEVVRLLAVELSARGLTAANEIAADTASAARSFFRSVFAGALLAWCDQTTGAGVLHITASSQAGHAELKLRFEPNDHAALAEPVRAQRPIGWDDVQVMAAVSGATLSRGDGWLLLQLARSPE
jgi:hypothetical protein